MAKTLALLIMVVLLASCRTVTQYVPVESVRYTSDTLRLTQTRVDSVFVRDSVTLLQRGDTVFLTKYRDRFRYRDHIDTVYRAVVDTARVKVPYPVEKKLTKWQQAKQDVGGMAIGGVAIALCVAVAWLIKKFRK